MKVLGIANELQKPSKTAQAVPVGLESFGTYFEKALKEVNNLQLEADEASKKLVLGEIDDIHSVMIATEKANLALQFTVQVRNKLVEAYQEVMRMQM